MDGLEYFQTKIVDRLHLPNLNKISKVDQKVYLNKLTHRSYESEIETNWVSAGYAVYKNIHLIKLPECDEKRSSRACDRKVENSKKKSSLSIVGNNALYKKAKQGVMCTKESVAIETYVPTLTVTMTAEIEARNAVHEDMNIS